MKKVKVYLLFVTIIVLVSGYDVYASPGTLSKNSIISCGGVTYGSHGDGHYHRAEKRGTRWYPQDDAIYANNPCGTVTTKKTTKRVTTKSSTTVKSTTKKSTTKSVTTKSTTTKPPTNNESTSEVTSTISTTIPHTTMTTSSTSSTVTVKRTSTTSTINSANNVSEENFEDDSLVNVIIYMWLVALIGTLVYILIRRR